MNDRIAFYDRVVGTWLPDPEAAVLVVGAEENDQGVFESRGFRNVTLLNLAEAPHSLPAGWKYVRASGDRLPFPDDSFDAVIAHATLHHCRSPHAALLEMYRTCGRLAMFIEARDSMLMRVIERLGVTQVYETSAVHFNDGVRGGVDDTAIPNFIYRWTEREVEKTIRTYAPQQDPQFRYLYGLALPQTPQAENGRGLLRTLVAATTPLARVFLRLFPRQQNLFAACICKPAGHDRLQPWLTRQADGSITFDRVWGQRRFRRTLSD
jgi:SAM-dependent methyltransferase